MLLFSEFCQVDVSVVSADPPGSSSGNLLCPSRYLTDGQQGVSCSPVNPLNVTTSRPRSEVWPHWWRLGLHLLMGRQKQDKGQAFPWSSLFPRGEGPLPGAGAMFLPCPSAPSSPPWLAPLLYKANITSSSPRSSPWPFSFFLLEALLKNNKPHKG